ncbi:hypothetical protein AA0Z99_00970 [Agrococcus sp. 1P02AA]|uniref:hypothetical protein n=1 Tax=Agrococcus sp. 1P02AA TaxID=3132259 RepID=UPI0039A43550
MRNLWNGIVNWVAALVGAIGGAPHPMVATDDLGPRSRDAGQPSDGEHERPQPAAEVPGPDEDPERHQR